MHDRLFENTKALEPLSGHAEALGLNVKKFDKCMESEKYAAEIRKDMATARNAGARGTPAFVLGKTDPDDPNKVIGVKFLKGARHISAFRLEIEKALKAIAQ